MAKERILQDAVSNEVRRTIWHYSSTMRDCLTVKELHVQEVMLRTSVRCLTVES
jgi:hypothetical protein